MPEALLAAIGPVWHSITLAAIVGLATASKGCDKAVRCMGGGRRWVGDRVLATTDLFN